MNTSIKSVKKVFFFETEDGYEVLIDKFEDGWAECAVPISAEAEATSIVICIPEVEEFIKFIYGCFTEDSNFKEVLLEAFGYPPDSEFIGIKIKLEDAYRTITAENSAFFDIWKLLDELVKEYVAIVTKNINDNIKEESEKTEKFCDLMSEVDVEFSNDEAEEIYYEKSEDEDVDEGITFYSEFFVAYVQYLIKKERISIQEAIEDTYDMFEELDLYIPEPNEIQLICGYCKYGNEIYQGVVNILLRRFNDELDYL